MVNKALQTEDISEEFEKVRKNRSEEEEKQ